MADLVRVVNPKMQFLDSNGLPASGYRLFTYRDGTTNTKATTYLDKAGNTQNTNPIVLNQRGECDVWVQTTDILRLELYRPGTDDPPVNGDAVWTGTSGPAPEKVIGFGGVLPQPDWLGQTARLVITAKSTDNLTLTLGVVGDVTGLGLAAGRRISLTMGPSTAPVGTYYGSLQTNSYSSSATSATGLNGTTLTSTTGITTITVRMDADTAGTQAAAYQVSGWALGFVDPSKNPVPLQTTQTYCAEAGHALTADRATNATSANFATNAGNAATAANAENSDIAINYNRTSVLANPGTSRNIKNAVEWSAWNDVGVSPHVVRWSTAFNGDLVRVFVNSAAITDAYPYPDVLIGTLPVGARPSGKIVNACKFITARLESDQPFSIVASCTIEIETSGQVKRRITCGGIDFSTLYEQAGALSASFVYWKENT